ncbi:MAG TPA: peptide deformylase [Acidimicrobiales bacterium]|nr:peptide deformylase [Acidimicrobiales bacterium]
MTARRVRIIGDPVLRRRADEVVDFDRSLRRLVRDLEDTMEEAGGVGLAAPQIGVGLRVFTYGVDDPASEDHMTICHLVNPVIVEESVDEVDDAEGCLSIPDLSFTLPRPRRLVAKGFNVHGEPLEVAGTERLARCLAHETDHLDGILFIDRLDPEKRAEALAEIRRLMLEGEAVRVRESPHASL